MTRRYLFYLFSLLCIMTPAVVSVAMAGVVTQTPLPGTKTPLWSTAVPSPTPIPPPPNSIKLPSWAADPHALLLLLRYRVSTYVSRPVLVNVATGEQFDFPQLEMDGYFWMPDGKSIGFVIDSNHVALVELQSGDVSLHNLFHAKHSHEIVTGPLDPESLIAFGDRIETPDFFLRTAGEKISANDRYLAIRYQEGYNYLCTRVFNLQTGKEIFLRDLLDDQSDVELNWSPVGPYLAVTRVNSGFWAYLKGDKDLVFSLKIFDMEKRTVWGVYRDIRSPEWSPDGKQLLYQPWSSRGLHFAPCIYTIATGSTHCLNALEQIHPGLKHKYSRLYKPKWYLDNLTIISYILETQIIRKELI